jgi:hypothetical protein
VLTDATGFPLAVEWSGHLLPLPADRARRTLGHRHPRRERREGGRREGAGKRNRFITLAGGERSVNRELEAKARTLAGWKNHITNTSTALAVSYLIEDRTGDASPTPPNDRE